MISNKKIDRNKKISTKFKSRKWVQKIKIENEYNNDTNHSPIRVLVSACVKFIIYFSIRTYFFYFTILFLQNTHIRLFIILTFLFK